MGNLDKFLSYDVEGLKADLEEAEQVPDYHDPKYFEYMKQRQRAEGTKMSGEAKVEKYKISKEMMEFSKNFKKVQKLSSVLQQGLTVQLAEADKIRQMLHETNAVRQAMLQNAPKNPTHEVEGQEVDIKNLYINY